jgi:phosphoribosylamine--glycine ligase
MLVSDGYPGDYEKGKPIAGLDEISDSIIFHAGTTAKGDKILTNGGRVIAVSSYGKNKDEALCQSFKNIDAIHFDGMYYRKDIGFDV